MPLAEIIKTGMNNPECSFFVGQFIGTTLIIHIMIGISIISFLAKVIDKLALESLIEWVKGKWYKRK